MAVDRDKISGRAARGNIRSNKLDRIFMWWRSNESVDSRITVTPGRYRDFFFHRFSDTNFPILSIDRSRIYIYKYISILSVGFRDFSEERAATLAAADRFVDVRSDAISRKNILRVLITVHDS